jgi:hypothetical protein
MFYHQSWFAPTALSAHTSVTAITTSIAGVKQPATLPIAVATQIPPITCYLTNSTSLDFY